MDIGRIARSMLRMEDKCGNMSIYAHSARMHPGMEDEMKLGIYIP